MDVETLSETGPALEVLTDEELTDIVGGDLYETMNSAISFVTSKTGGCQCGVGH